MKEKIDTLDIRDEYELDENGNPNADSTDGSEYEVVGESFVKDNIKSVFVGAVKKFGENNSIAEIDVILIPEVGNPYDKKSVRVDALLSIKDKEVNSIPIGHLPRESARGFRKAFPNKALIAKGYIDAGYWLDDNEKDFSVTIQVPLTVLDKYDWQPEG